MPYLDNYLCVLSKIGIDYDLIVWDRFKIDNFNLFTYQDKKIGHKREFFDYYKYSIYIKNILKKNEYEKCIIFGIQLSYFLSNYLSKFYKDNYIIDIRDYNILTHTFTFKKV